MTTSKDCHCFYDSSGNYVCVDCEQQGVTKDMNASRFRKGGCGCGGTCGACKARAQPPLKARERRAIARFVKATSAFMDSSSAAGRLVSALYDHAEATGDSEQARDAVRLLQEAIAAYRAAVEAARRDGTPEEDIDEASVEGMGMDPDQDEGEDEHWADSDPMHNAAAVKVRKAARRLRRAVADVPVGLATLGLADDGGNWSATYTEKRAPVSPAVQRAVQLSSRRRFLAHHGIARHRV